MKYTVSVGDKTLGEFSASEMDLSLFSSSFLPKHFVLSNFCLLRRENNTFVLEHPLSEFKVALDADIGIRVIGALAKPQTFEYLSTLELLPQEKLLHFLTLLFNAQMIEEVEEVKPHLAHWEFHDLLFHHRSRHNDLNAPYGGTFRFKGKYPPMPPLKEIEGETISLYRPNLEELKKTDPTFTQVLEGRKSVRSGFAKEGMPFSKLGEFLFRTARVKEIKSNGTYDYTTRPYPGGGACYELEIYLIAEDVQGLQKALFYYHPKKHALIPINSNQDELDHYLNTSFRFEEKPHVYFCITARFRRVSWKYEKLSYALILKNLGVLYQTMYLVATAMGLGACGSGGGNSKHFAEFIQDNPLEEALVGEFVLSTLTS